MNDQLEAIKAAYETGTETGNFGEARSLSVAYVQANAAEFEDMKSMTVPECVAAVDAFRAANMQANLWQMEAWIFAYVPPQNIGGTYQAIVNVNLI